MASSFECPITVQLVACGGGGGDAVAGVPSLPAVSRFIVISNVFPAHPGRVHSYTDTPGPRDRSGRVGK